MKSFRLGFLLLVLLGALPTILHAQDTSIMGTVVDSTGAVLPGVTITAVHQDSGNRFVAITDERGDYRLGGLRTGAYTVSSELTGFSTVTRPNIELQVGQRLVLNLRMSLEGVQESVTVTGAAPLIEATQSKLGGHVDTRQMSELPLNGRNWLDLTTLAPGSRVNATGENPTLVSNNATFQINLDGQQVTNLLAGTGFGQPRYSRDAIGEFEFVTSRFDATQGRSSGVQINAVTKAGTNTPSGTFSGYFRDDALNAKDFIVNRVLPYQDQQISTTFGGPLKRDRVHLFGYYEGEREPRAFTFTSPYPAFNIPDISSTRTENKGGFRFDTQFTNRTHLMLRGNIYKENNPNEPGSTGGATNHPSRTNFLKRSSTQLFATLTQTLGPRALNQIKGGYTGFVTDQDGLAAPQIQLRGYTLGKTDYMPLWMVQETYSIRDDYTRLVSKHELKMGGEFLKMFSYVYWAQSRDGTLDATGGPVPANIASLFPVWDDPSTWNLAPLSPLAVRYRQGFGNFYYTDPQELWAAWLQDNWTMTPKLTLNLGVRWDVHLGSLAEDVVLPPFRPTTTPHDLNNVVPRLGFAYTLNDRTVLRGGWGKYFEGIVEQWSSHSRFYTQVTIPEIPNDGRPDFASNPFNGKVPTPEELATMRRTITTGSINSPTVTSPYTYQSSIGIERQIASDVSVKADYIWAGGRQLISTRNINLSYDPATGANYPFSDISKRPYPDWGIVSMRFTDGWNNYHGLETGFTKRMSNHWQASGTYTLSGYWDGVPSPVNNAFPVAPDLGDEYTLAAGDQRHRAVLNGIWELPYHFQMSGLYFFGSGQRYATSYGADLRDSGGKSTRLRPDGTIAPRTGLVGRPVHRTDLRVTRRFPIFGRTTVDGIFEVFNLFNHANYGSYVTTESNPRYGQPQQNTNVAYQPRMIQLGFRLAF